MYSGCIANFMVWCIHSIMAAKKFKGTHSQGIALSSSVAVPFLIEAMRKSFSFTGNAQSHTTITCSFAVALLLYHPCQERNCIIILLIGSAREGSATLPLGLRGRKCLLGRHTAPNTVVMVVANVSIHGLTHCM